MTSLNASDREQTAAAAANYNNDQSTTPTPTQPLYRYVALDLDGTLLNSDHKISERTKRGLRDLHDRGLGILFATGRAISTVYEHVVALNLPTPLPVVCSNGASAVLCTIDPTVQPHGVRTQELFTTAVPPNVAAKTIRLALQCGHVSQYYVNGQIYAHPSTETHYKYTALYKQLTGSHTIYVSPDVFCEQMLETGLPTKQLVLFPETEQDATLDLFVQTMTDDPSLHVNGKPANLVRGSLGWFLEVLHPHVTKGAGLERLCQTVLDVPLDAVVAFGDGDNDLEFLQVAGRGVVMVNGRTVVKKIANQITEYTNNQDGVYLTLVEMEKKGLLATTKTTTKTTTTTTEEGCNDE